MKVTPIAKDDTNEPITTEEGTHSLNINDENMPDLSAEAKKFTVFGHRTEPANLPKGYPSPYRVMSESY